VSLEGGLLKIDLREPRRELAASLRALRRARRLVVSDPEIMGGNPVFRGTRVPVHPIAELIAQGAAEAELLDGYPRLTPEMIRLASFTPPPIPYEAGRANSPGMVVSRRIGPDAGSRRPRHREISDRRAPHRRVGYRRRAGRS
jgi:uncharacterized protein (DUF433 family)